MKKVKDNFGFLNALKTDLPASFVVFLVALPLSIGIATASKAPVAAGLIAGIIGGILGSWLGGARLQVSGPAAGLTVVVAGLVDELDGNWRLVCLVTMGAGILQFIFGLTGISKVVLSIAPTVVHAMLAGIGITIVLQQIHILFNGEPNSTAFDNLKELPSKILEFDYFFSLIVGLIVVGIILIWPKISGKLSVIPGSLVGILAAILINKVGADSLPDLPTVSMGDSTIIDLIKEFQLPDFGNTPWQIVITGIVTVAIITSVESLLSAVAVDKLSDAPKTNFDRELTGQGIANFTSGFLGGLPVTGVIVRSATNIKAGAKTRLSGMLHGVWILVFALFFADFIELIPENALAALLIVVGIQLLNVGEIKDALKRGDFLVYISTLLGVVFLNLLEGVAIGVTISLILLFARISKPKIELIQLNSDKPENRQEWLFIIQGTASFITAPKIASILESIPEKSIVTLDLNVDFIDNTAFESIENWRLNYEANGGTTVTNLTNHINIDDITERKPKKIDFKHSPLRPSVPWKPSKYRHYSDEDKSKLTPLKEGFNNYIANDLETVLPTLRKLRNKQNPQAVFLTCGDSRVIPNLITGTGPGDLFTLRNVGNIIPTNGTDKSVEAGIEYAITALKVPTIIVCGHSSCGAMAGLYSGLGKPGEENASAVEQWLESGYKSLVTFNAGHPLAENAAKQGFSELDQLSMVNVQVQVEILKNMDIVKKNNVKIEGIFFDIATGNIGVIDSKSIEFPPININATNKIGENEKN